MNGDKKKQVRNAIFLSWWCCQFFVSQRGCMVSPRVLLSKNLCIFLFDLVSPVISTNTHPFPFSSSTHITEFLKDFSSSFEALLFPHSSMQSAYPSLPTIDLSCRVCSEFIFEMRHIPLLIHQVWVCSTDHDDGIFSPMLLIPLNLKWFSRTRTKLFFFIFPRKCEVYSSTILPFLFAIFRSIWQEFYSP